MKESVDDFRKSTMYFFLSRCLRRGISELTGEDPKEFRDFVKKLIESGKKLEDLTEEDNEKAIEIYCKKDYNSGAIGILANTQRREKEASLVT